MVLKIRSKILVIDDNVGILRMITRLLELEGFEVITAENGKTGIALIDSNKPDLVLLDVMMADINGHTVCQRIRDFSDVPIIMLSSKAGDQDITHGLSIGADDYVTKPFSAGELTARIRAHLRRHQNLQTPEDTIFRHNDFEINFATNRVIMNDKELILSAKEYKLLSCLARNADRVLTYEQLLSRVWGEEYVSDTHILQVNIARLRKKLGENANNPSLIQKRNGIGYIMTKQNPD